MLMHGIVDSSNFLCLPCSEKYLMKLFYRPIKLQNSANAWQLNSCACIERNLCQTLIIRLLKVFIMIEVRNKITNGCLALADDSPRRLLTNSLFSAFPWRSLALYCIFREVSLAGFHASVSIPFRIPMNFLEWKLIVELRPFPPCKIIKKY